MAAAVNASQPGVMPWISLPLVKFSYSSNSSEHDAHINWVHLPQRDNLFVVFDSVRIKLSATLYRETRILKIVCGADILENVNLDELMQERQVAEQRVGASQLQNSQLPIAVIVQSPCIAMRYKMRTGQMRRFQIRCMAESDYNIAVDILKQVGLPLKESAPQKKSGALSAPTMRPTSSSQAGLLPPTSQPHIGFSRSAYTAVAPSESLQGYSIPDSMIPRNNVQQHRPNSATAYNSSSKYKLDHLENLSQTQVPSSGRSFSMYQHDSSAREDVDQMPASVHSNPIDSRFLTEWPLGRPYTSSGLSQGTAPSEEERKFNFLMPPPLERAGLTDRSHPYASASSEFPPRPESRLLQRPTTAPASQAETLTQLLPPKRELPSGKPMPSRTTESKEPAAKPWKSVLDLPPLPTPTTIDKAEVASTVTRSSTEKKLTVSRSRKISTQRSNRKGAANARIYGKPDGISTSETPAYEPLQPSLAPATKVAPEITATSETRSKLPLATLGDAAENSRRNESKRSMRESEDQTPSDFSLPAQASSSRAPKDSNTAAPIDPTEEQWMDHIDAFVARHAGRPSPMQAVDLSDYAAQSDEDRLAQIDNMICDYLMDDNFLKLCEDVESSWRRVALG